LSRNQEKDGEWERRRRAVVTAQPRSSPFDILYASTTRPHRWANAWFRPDYQSLSLPRTRFIYLWRADDSQLPYHYPSFSWTRSTQSASIRFDIIQFVSFSTRDLFWTAYRTYQCKAPLILTTLVGFPFSVRLWIIMMLSIQPLLVPKRVLAAHR
jgi:hypothetical protein